eukprot:c30700_g1_i1 orf=2-196(-)
MQLILSQYIVVAKYNITLHSNKSLFNYNASHAAVLKAIYSSFADEGETMGCFFIFHEIAGVPKKE